MTESLVCDEATFPAHGVAHSLSAFLQLGTGCAAWFGAALVAEGGSGDALGEGDLDEAVVQF